MRAAMRSSVHRVYRRIFQRGIIGLCASSTASSLRQGNEGVVVVVGGEDVDEISLQARPRAY
jgi:hypothetical protein